MNRQQLDQLFDRWLSPVTLIGMDADRDRHLGVGLDQVKHHRI